MTVHATFTTSRSVDFTVSIDLELVDGSTTALLGPNGAGKSTVVSSLAGLLPISSGHVTIDGRVVDAPDQDLFVPAHQRNIGVVFQDHQLFDHLSVRENVSFGPQARGLRRGDVESITNMLLGRFELQDLADRRPPMLSGGQAQRVSMARAMATEPDLLLLDEPLSALDVATRSRVRRSLADQLSKFSGPSMLITHDPTDAFLLADQIVVIEKGQVIQVGSPDEIRRHPATPYVAALSGRNLLQAVNEKGVLTVDGSEHRLRTSDTSQSGSVLVSIAPSAIALHPSQPHGSPRNTWETTVTAIEPLGDTTRVTIGEPLSLRADLTPGAVAALGLGPGSSIWVSIKATEIDVTTV